MVRVYPSSSVPTSSACVCVRAWQPGVYNYLVGLVNEFAKNFGALLQPAAVAAVFASQDTTENLKGEKKGKGKEKESKSKSKGKTSTKNWSSDHPEQSKRVAALKATLRDVLCAATGACPVRLSLS